MSHLESLIFPLEQLERYSSSNLLPDELSYQTIIEKSHNIQDLLSHCQKILNFLELNKIHGQPYRLESPAFLALFEQFRIYYKSQPILAQDKNTKLELIRMEQTIHLITNISGTQDISTYLDLFEQMYDDEKFYDLVLLLQRKYDTCNANYSQLHVNWLNFLAPFMKYLVQIDFDYQKILELSLSSITELVNRSITNLNGFVLEIEQKEQNMDDFQLLLSKLRQFRENLFSAAVPRNSEFYRQLGELTFLINLLNFCISGDQMLLRMCIMTLPYFDKITKIIPLSEEAKKDFFSFESVKINLAHCKSFMDQLVDDLTHKVLNNHEKTLKLQLLQCLLCSIFMSKEEHKKFTPELTSASNSLVENIFHMIQTQKELLENSKAPHFEGFFNYYEFFTWMLFEMIKPIFDDLNAEKISQDVNNFLSMIEKNIEDILQTKGLKLFIKEYYYLFAFKLALHKKGKFHDRISKNWNFSANPLQEILNFKDKTDLDEMYLNLKYSYLFVVERNHKIESSCYDNLANFYKDFVSKISQKIEDEYQKDKLRRIGIVLTGIIRFNITQLRPLKIQFLQSMLQLFPQKAQLYPWELFIFEENLWKMLTCSQIYAKLIFQDESMFNFLAFCENQMLRIRTKVTTFSNYNEIFEDKQVKEKLYNFILSCLCRIKNEVSALWNEFDANLIKNQENTHKILAITSQQRKLFYFILPWALRIIISVSQKNVGEEDLMKLKTILRLLAYLYFHPSWVSSLEHSENKFLWRYYIKIIRSCEQVRQYAVQIFYEALNEILVQINAQHFTDPENKRELRDFIQIIRLEKYLSHVQERFSTNYKRYAFIYCIMRRLSKLNEFFTRGEEIYVIEKEKEITHKILKDVLNQLNEFVLYVGPFYDAPTLADEQSKHYKVDNLFLKASVSGFRGVIKLLYGIMKNHDFLASFFENLLNRAFTIENSANFIVELFLNTIISFKGQLKNSMYCLSFSQKAARKGIFKCIFDTFAIKITSLNENNQYSRNIEARIKLISLLAPELLSFISSEQNIKEMEEKASIGLDDSNSNNKLMLHILKDFADHLRHFPKLVLINQNDEQIKQKFIPILQIFEKVYIYAKREFSEKVYLERIKVQKIQGSTNNNNDELENIRNTNKLLDESFFSNVDLFWYIYQFKELDDAACDLLKTKCVARLAKCLGNFSYLDIKEAYSELPKELADSPYENITRDINFVEIKTTQNNILDHLLTLQTYLRKIISILNQIKTEAHVEGALVWHLYYDSLLLWDQLPKIERMQLQEQLKKFPNMTESIIDLIEDLALLLASYFTNNYQEIGSLAIFTWVENVLKLQALIQKMKDIDILVLRKTILSSLARLMEIALAVNPSSAINYLLNDSKLLKDLMGPRKSAETAYIHHLTVLLDAILKYSLNDEIFIETKLKQIWGEKSAGSNPLPLINLTENDFIIEKEHISMKNLVTILVEKFKVFPLEQHSIPEDCKPERLCFSLNFAQEDISPQQSVQRTLGSIPLEVLKMMDILKESLIENYLFNLSRLAEIDDMFVIKNIAFRQTSSILAAMSILLEKYRCLIADIAFRRNDYSHIVSTYSQNIPFLQKIKPQSFQSLTFLECLFKTKYLIFSEQDILVLIQLLMLNTGITFTFLQNSESVLDISRIITIKLILHLIKEIEDVDDTTIPLANRYQLLCIIVTSASCIYSCLDKKSLNDKFGQYTNLCFQSLIKSILNSFKLIPEVYAIYCSIGNMEILLAELLKQYYLTLLSLASLTHPAIEQLKELDFESFLIDKDLKDYKSCIHMIEHLDYPEIKTDKLEYSKKNLDLKDTDIKATSFGFDKNGKFFDQMTPLNLPINCNSSIFPNEPWPKTLLKIVTSAKEVGLIFLVACQNQNIPNSLRNIIQNFEEYFKVMRLELVEKSQSEQPSMNLLRISNNSKDDQNIRPQRFYDIILQKLQEKSDGNIENSTIKEEANLKMDNNQPAEKVEELKLENENFFKAKLRGKAEKPQYFIGLDIQNKNEFDNIKFQTLSKLKLISEQILFDYTVLSSPSDDTQNLKEEIVKREIYRQLSLLSEFEQNMLLCNIDKFEGLKDFKCPAQIQKLREELDWIENNFQLYMDYIQAHKGSKYFMTNPVSNSNNLLATGFQFCNDYSLDIVPDPPKNDIKITTKLDENRPLFQQLYLIDDKTVESLISLFYIKYEKGMNQIIIQILQELCKSATFETKLIDFCFSFLYCPDYLQGLSQKSPKDGRFPYINIFNSNGSFKLSEVYEIVAENIIDFLNSLIANHEGVIYRPIIFFENYGLKSLEDLKEKTRFIKQVSHKISSGDLLIGLLEVDIFNQKPKFSSKLEFLILKMFSTPKNFEIAETDEIETIKKESKLLTYHSCKLLLKMKNIGTVIKNLSNIVLYGIDSLIDIIQDNIQNIYSPLEKVNACLKYKVYNDPGRLNLSDIKGILENHIRFQSLAENLLLISSTMLQQLFTRERMNMKQSLQNNIKPQRTFLKALKKLKEQVLDERIVEDFFLHMFELSNYLSFEDFTTKQESNNFMLFILKACTAFYALVKIQESPFELTSMQVKLLSPGLPTLSNVISGELNENSGEKIPELKTTYSNLRRSREFDLDCLLTDLGIKHQNLLPKIIYENDDRKIVMKEIAFICGKLPWFIDLSTKRLILKDVIEKDLLKTDVGTGTRTINIDRKEIIKTTLDQFSNLPLKVIKKKVQIKFVNENGFDGGGLKREWMTIIAKELFDPKKGLFEISNNQNSIQLSPLSRMVPDHLKYIEFAGIILGKVIQEGVVVDVNFSKPMLKHILGHHISLKDLEDIDSDLAKSLKWMLDNEVEGLDQTFTYEIQAFGQRITRELKPNGHSILVTEENKREFVKRFCEMKVKGEIQEELEAFIRGIYLIIPPECLGLFSPSELQLLIGGVPTIDPKELEKYTKYNGYERNGSVIKWFWEIMTDFSAKERAAFIMFTTGSVRVSYEILKEKPLRITQIENKNNCLPIANTCSHQIQIPQYTSKQEMKQKLLIAIFEGQGSFAFG